MTDEHFEKAHCNFVGSNAVPSSADECGENSDNEKAAGNCNVLQSSAAFGQKMEDRGLEPLTS